MKPEEQTAAPLPTIDEEIAAIRAVLEALVKLPSREAQGRVLAHASRYLGGPDGRW